MTESKSEQNLQEEKIESKQMKKKCRINAFISSKNYLFINDLMDKEELISMRLSKGAILDLALTNLAMSLESGELLEMIAVNHLERRE